MIHRGFLAILLACAMAGCGKSRSGAGSPLRIGMDLSYPPFEMQDASGTPDGVSVRIAEALAKDLGRPLQIVPMDFTGLIPALKTGNIDLILSSMSATDERRKSIDFSEPYAFTGLAMLVRKDSTIQSVEDLKKPGITIAAKAATTGEIYAIEHLPQAKRVVFEDQNACVLEVVQGRADAFIYDQLTIYKYAEQNPDTTRGLLKPITEESWAIGLAKGNGELKSKVNAFIAKFREEKGFEKLGDRYLSDEKKFLRDAGIPFILR